MNLITPIHQFEVRYSSILDFPNVIGEAIAPYVQLATKLNVDNENSHLQQIVLNFEQDFYIITVTWDRLLVQTNGFKKGLNANNSIVDNPYFDILKKVKEISAFGEIKNILFYSFNINLLDNELDEIKINFDKKYLCDATRNLLPSIEDTGITLEHHKDNYEIHLTFGPYIGPEDLKKRKLTIKNPILFEDVKKHGEILQFKYFEECKTVSFAKYKEITEIEQKYLNKLWKK